MSTLRQFTYTSSSFAVDPDTRALRLLLGVNGAVFLNWHLNFPLSASAMQNHFLASVSGVFREHKVHTLLTSAVSHISASHLLVNGLGIYFFGSNIFAYFGRRFALGLYCVAGAAGAFAQLYPYYNPKSRYVNNVHVLGASAAVSSFVVFQALWTPMQTVYLYYFIPMPMFMLGMGWVALDLYQARNDYQHSGVGHHAHLAGAGIGALAWGLKRFRVI